MRLLHIKSDGHLEFTKDIIRVEEIPPYAILSHTWKEPEVVFNDLKSCGIMGVVDPEKRDGWNKIQFCAQQAKRDNLDHFWVDTCCIDKANNTELSEAINSMFRWYQNADRCYVFLTDVGDKSSAGGSRPSSQWKTAFRASRWFTRGWTLQELLAPRSVEFFSADGARLGDKDSLKQTIHEVTGIPIEAFSSSDMSKFDVSERFTWAENRQTTREEDGAYCLLGIVGCYLPLIYGEGKENALNRLRKEMQGGERLAQIRSWLSAPDPSSNYQKAHNQRQPGTGQWLLQEHENFKNWKEDAASRLWLYGIPGCGKTILSSTVVEHLQHHCGDDKRKVTVYFYFDFNDAQKQIPELMLRSLLRQLLQHTITIPECVDALFASCGDGQQQPPLHKLLTVAPQVMGQFTHVYIVLDALDECTQRPGLMDLLIAIDGLRLDGVHLLMTSRKERDIETSLETFVVEDNMISLQRDVVDEDILRFVQQKLDDDRRLEKWNKNPEVRQEIETALMRGAQGMFRWVTCQLDMIAECRNLAMLRKSLATLPKTLDQTYDRILTAISEEDRIYTIRILQWLTFSARPLTLKEVAEIAAIDIGREPAFNRDEVLVEPLEALKICSSLVTVKMEKSDSYSDWYLYMDPDYYSEPEVLSGIVTLAHYSVQEYLVSERIKLGPAKQYSMTESGCHKAMTIGCLGYLNQFQEPLTPEVYYASALADYSAKFWNNHLQKTGDEEEEMSRLAMDLLFTNDPVLANSIRIFVPDLKETYDEQTGEDEIGSPLYYASTMGLKTVTKLLLDQNVDVDAEGGFHGSALWAAFKEGHLAVAELLVNAKADVNAKSIYGESALHEALELYDNDKAIVKVLIDAGADVNKRDANGYAIQRAALMGDEGLVEMLIDANADINAHDEGDDHALIIAIRLGNYAIAQLLIKAGANANMRDKDHSALQIASFRGEESVVRLLIEAGAHVNALGNEGFGNALLAAAKSGHTAVAELLLDKGAEIDVQDAKWGSALHAAVRSSQETTAEVLLRRGASLASDMQSKGVMNHAVDSPNCTSSLVRMLQQYNVPLDTIDVANMTPLHYCVKWEHEAVAQQLIDSGVHIDTGVLRQGWSSRVGISRDSQVNTISAVSKFTAIVPSPLHDAVSSGMIGMIKFLMQHGADPYLINPSQESPLEHAIKMRDDKAVEVLLSMGANMSPPNEILVNALHHAAQIKNQNIMVAILESEQAKAITLVTLKDENGYNVLHHLLSMKSTTQATDVKTVHWLLRMGANASELDHFGISPLVQYIQTSIWTLDIEICTSLLRMKGTSSFIGSEGRNLGHMCAERLDFGVPILKVLNEYGVDLARKDWDERTLLHCAAMNGSLTQESLEFLVEVVGINASAEDKYGCTALQYAVKAASKTPGSIRPIQWHLERTRDILTKHHVDHIDHASVSIPKVTGAVKDGRTGSTSDDEVDDSTER
ncbi:uncharacterized protein J4E88_009510 [Alternaria novae-zelandiae]|uniref:uncharacterized protein n=1 Tax=Alternaria novae-zelandiae TaxID=430562 RepID=UPI0020C2946D|nr:uncharacterized protein J4E88_009510 [Alternaria novae-zelandiae]KAI4671112.1 hypothetical protein J4E88_009510 [Alternaria novae-zelandiae]